MTKKNNNCALSSANAWGSNNRKFYDIIDCVKFILLYQVHSFIFFSLWSILIEFQFGLIYLKFNELERFLIQLTHLSIIVQFLGFTGLFELQIPLLVIMSGHFHFFCSNMSALISFDLPTRFVRQIVTKTIWWHMYIIHVDHLTIGRHILLQIEYLWHQTH